MCKKYNLNISAFVGFIVWTHLYSFLQLWRHSDSSNTGNEHVSSNKYFGLVKNFQGGMKGNTTLHKMGEPWVWSSLQWARLLCMAALQSFSQIFTLVLCNVWTATAASLLKLMWCKQHTTVPIPMFIFQNSGSKQSWQQHILMHQINYKLWEHARCYKLITHTLDRRHITQVVCAMYFIFNISQNKLIFLRKAHWLTLHHTWHVFVPLQNTYKIILGVSLSLSLSLSLYLYAHNRYTNFH